MIVLKTLKFRNFLSVGNSPVEFNFNNSVTLIHGDNGSGKSLVIDALHYVLYNSCFRPKANLSEIVNRRNKKELVVELTLESNGKEYKIIRGRKPDIFQIFQNDELLEQNASSRSQQEFLEKNVIKISKEVFSQICVTGKSNYNPYMDLSMPDRRKFIETVFSLTYFQRFIEIANEQLKKTMDKIREDEQQCLKIEYEIKNIEDVAKVKLESKRELITTLNQKIEDTRNKIQIQTEEFQSLEKKKADLESEYDSNEYSRLKSKRDDHKSETAILDREIQRLRRTNSELDGEILRLQRKEGTLCESCGQQIPENLYESKITEKQNIIKLNTRSINDKENLINDTNDKIKILEESISKLDRVSNLIGKVSIEISYCLKSIRDLKDVIKSTLNQIESLESEISVLSESNLDVSINYRLTLSGIRKTIDANQSRVEYFKALKEFSGDKGYKAFILDRYKEEIQFCLNKNVSIYGLPFELELNPDFSIEIYDFSKKKISYFLLSEGQKQRINLSVWDSFIDVIRAKNHTFFNVLFFDEVLDGSLDYDGKNVFLSTLRNKAEFSNMNIYVISHSMTDFENKIEVKMDELGFSNYIFGER
jgi:DNA repair exonuclease SbcCD ATPase subunit